MIGGTTIQVLQSAVSWARCQTPSNCYGKSEEKREERKNRYRKVSVVEDILNIVVNELFITVWGIVRIKNSSIMQYQTESARHTHLKTPDKFSTKKMRSDRNNAAHLFDPEKLKKTSDHSGLNSRFFTEMVKREWTGSLVGLRQKIPFSESRFRPGMNSKLEIFHYILKSMFAQPCGSSSFSEMTPPCTNTTTLFPKSHLGHNERIAKMWWKTQSIITFFQVGYISPSGCYWGRMYNNRCQRNPSVLLGSAKTHRTGKCCCRHSRVQNNCKRWSISPAKESSNLWKQSCSCPN